MSSTSVELSGAVFYSVDTSLSRVGLADLAQGDRCSLVSGSSIARNSSPSSKEADHEPAAAGPELGDTSITACFTVCSYGLVQFSMHVLIYDMSGRQGLPKIALTLRS